MCCAQQEIDHDNRNIAGTFKVLLENAGGLTWRINYAVVIAVFLFIAPRLPPPVWVHHVISHWNAHSLDGNFRDVFLTHSLMDSLWHFTGWKSSWLWPEKQTAFLHTDIFRKMYRLICMSESSSVLRTEQDEGSFKVEQVILHLMDPHVESRVEEMHRNTQHPFVRVRLNHSECIRVTWLVSSCFLTVQRLIRNCRRSWNRLVIWRLTVRWVVHTDKWFFRSGMLLYT